MRLTSSAASRKPPRGPGLDARARSGNQSDGSTERPFGFGRWPDVVQTGG